MDKRKMLFDLVFDGVKTDYVPAAFFLHFPQEFRAGSASARKHLEYFRATGMDFVKIQFEGAFPGTDSLTKPSDWARYPLRKVDYYEGQIKAVTEIVKEIKEEAAVVVTLYSPLMMAVHASGEETFNRHMEEDPEAVGKGLDIITESLLIFVDACAGAGVDGFYASTQGGEVYRFKKKETFTKYIKPYDLRVWERLTSSCRFNILHVCDYHGRYSDLAPFVDYPGNVVNTSLELTTGPVSAAAIRKQFGRPFMGGLDRHGLIVDGSEETIRSTVREVLSKNPAIDILAADCTLPADIDWKHIRAAIDAAHGV